MLGAGKVGVRGTSGYAGHAPLAVVIVDYRAAFGHADRTVRTQAAADPPTSFALIIIENRVQGAPNPRF